jgi:hypothetical protein
MPPDNAAGEVEATNFRMTMLDSFPVGLNRERFQFAVFAVLSEPSGDST